MSKKILHIFLTLAATLILTGGFPMTAHAGGGEEYETSETPEETATPSDPLTPEGNATLVDDIYGGNKQLITVTTKKGNYFYILIDRAAEGENTVYFLNMVDEADLMALIEDDGETEETTVMPQTCTCKEKCEAGAVNTSCPVCLNNLNSCTGRVKETEPETEAEPEQPKDNSKGTKSLLLLFLVTLLAGGGAFYYFKYIKPNDTAKGSPDFSDFDLDDDGEDTDYDDETDYDKYGEYTGDTGDDGTDAEAGETDFEEDTGDGV